MIQDSAQIRRRGAQDFKAYYDYACARQDSVPLPAVNMNLTKGILDLSGDRVKATDWLPILGSISINKHLHHIAIHSTYQAALNAGDVDSRCYKSSYRKKIPAICCKDTIVKLCKALRDCLAVSPSLKTLQLNGLPLRERDLITLTKGLGKNNSLESLSLANCPIGDDGLEVICQSVKYSASIKTVDFTGCNLTWRGAEHMANIIKHQGMRRHGEGWVQSLRYRQPQFEGMAGLRRVTLNCNLLIGDRGAASLAHELAEDLWVKAVDLQKCGLSNKGAQCLLESLKTNSTLCVLDIRSNPLVDKVLIKTTIEKILMNADGQSSEYNWIKPPTHKESPKPAGPKRRQLSNTSRGKAAFRIAPRRGTSAGRWSPGVVQQQRPACRSRGVPWRTAARSQRQRGLSPGLTMVEQSFQGAASVKVTLESELDEEEEEEEVEEVVVEVEPTPSAVSLRRMQMELEDCRMRLAEERRARLKAESRVMEHEMENARLRSVNLSMSEALVAPNYRSVATASSALEDEAVLDSIENSFTKFHAFLDLLKDAGLGQLASIAGIDQSDFSSLGKPQLSSSTRQPLGCEASTPVGDGGFQNIEAETNAAYTVGNPQLAASRDPADSLDHRPPSSGFLPADRPTELPLSQPSGPAIDPHVDLEGGGQEPDEYSKPEVQHDSGSERSFRSHKSYGSGSRSHKGFLVSSSHGKASKPVSLGHSNSNSHHSNGSHGSSLKHSNVYSSIHSDGSLSDLSVRSSVGDIMSEKAASVASSGSKGSGGRRRPKAGYSGSEGSEVKAYVGLDTMAQVRSLRSLGGQSDDDGSF